MNQTGNTTPPKAKWTHDPLTVAMAAVVVVAVVSGVVLMSRVVEQAPVAPEPVPNRTAPDATPGARRFVAVSADDIGAQAVLRRFASPMQDVVLALRDTMKTSEAACAVPAPGPDGSTANVVAIRVAAAGEGGVQVLFNAQVLPYDAEAALFVDEASGRTLLLALRVTVVHHGGVLVVADKKAAVCLQILFGSG
jgi:hypothetical protein